MLVTEAARLECLGGVDIRLVCLLGDASSLGSFLSVDLVLFAVLFAFDFFFFLLLGLVPALSVEGGQL